MPERSEQEALSRALEVVELAVKHPATFSELAERYSDDVVTRDEGGSLGGVRASQLPAEYRDALAQLRPGQVSRVIRSQFGYHVILRRPVPRDATVAGKRIVIRYRGTFGGPPGVASARTRPDALALARRVAQLARENTKGFDDLVAQYSENADKIQQGDLGVWSVRDPGYLSREVERLSALSMGQISEPMDSRFGFEILMRTEATPRKRYAMQAVELRFDPSVSAEHAASKAKVRARAQRLISDLEQDASRFERLQKQECCEGTRQWTSGRGPLGVDAVLEAVKLGAMARAPIESDWVYVIARRLDPSTLPEEPKPTYELPAPAAPDFEKLVATIEGSALAGNVRKLSAELQRALHLDTPRMQALERRMERLAVSFEKEWRTPEERVAGWRRTLFSVRGELGPEGYARFDRFLKAWATRMLMQLAR
jgi:parvulin-like peptidyl-prolyl isomerase